MRNFTAVVAWADAAQTIPSRDVLRTRYSLLSAKLCLTAAFVLPLRFVASS
jgi:hypothetical protein